MPQNRRRQNDPTARRIGVDWGTTHVRAWLLGAGGRVLDVRRDDRGMGRIAGDEAAFGAVYDTLVAGWPDVPALACGMVGARQGWIEAPYVEVPTALIGLASRAVSVTSPNGRRLAILPGICQREPADVMRGEETKLVGLALEAPDVASSGFALLPGTHSKHAALEEGCVVHFRSVPTGELFDVLGQHSLLRFSLERDGAYDAIAFDEAVLEGATLRAGELTAALFNLRARSLLEVFSPAAARGRLSGLLIGAELALLDRERPIALVGSGGMIEPISRAFRVLGRPAPRVFDGDALVRRALAHLAALLEGADL